MLNMSLSSVMDVPACSKCPPFRYEMPFGATAQNVCLQPFLVQFGRSPQSPRAYRRKIPTNWHKFPTDSQINMTAGDVLPKKHFFTPTTQKTFFGQRLSCLIAGRVCLKMGEPQNGWYPVGFPFKPRTRWLKKRQTHTIHIASFW